MYMEWARIIFGAGIRTIKSNERNRGSAYEGWSEYAYSILSRRVCTNEYMVCGNQKRSTGDTVDAHAQHVTAARNCVIMSLSAAQYGDFKTLFSTRR